MQRFSLALIASVTALVVGGAWAQGGAGGGQGTASPGTGSTSATGKAVMQQQTAAQMRDQLRSQEQVQTQARDQLKAQDRIQTTTRNQLRTP